MPLRIEDYALIGDCQTAALVGADGSIDWLCLPRFDSGACFAALLGGPEHGRWLLAPRVPVKRVTRSYRDGSLILDTTFATDDAEVVVTDCMPMRDAVPHIIRTVRGVRGRMAMRTELVVRFDYGSIVPWVRKGKGGGIRAIAGPDSIRLQSDVPLRGENLTTVAEFDVAPGDVVSLVLTWHPSHVKEPHEVDAAAVVDRTERAWRTWSAQNTYRGPHRRIVERSLVTLKALTHTATGGIVAAPTTSLPEAVGGVRNWDYRYCWLRDATFTLLALVHNGFTREAEDWREWLLRAVAGDPSQLQIMYAVDGRRRLDEAEIPWLPGYEASAPVRVGNAAFQQSQLDVYGEVMDALYQCHTHGLPAEGKDAWNHAARDARVPRDLLGAAGRRHLGGPRAAAALHALEGHGVGRLRSAPCVASSRSGRLRLRRDGRSARLRGWRGVRTRMHAEICERGYDPELDAFVQSYGSKKLDASLLMVPLVGFLHGLADPRRAWNRARDRGAPSRGRSRAPLRDRRPTGRRPAAGAEGVFLPCSFWLADNWALMDRRADATAMFERLVGLCNDVGLLSEEYDPIARRLVGNFPQAFSHVSLINKRPRSLVDHAGRPRRRRERRSSARDPK